MTGTLQSSFAPLYQQIVASGPSAAGAVALAAEFETKAGLALPDVYVSTAITSGGFARVAALPLREAITRNNAAAGHLASALAANDAPYVTPQLVMMPTELGAVTGWADSDYLLFYFCWLSGLSGRGAEWVGGQLADPIYAPILKVADARDITDNELRWAQYRTVAEILITNLALAAARPAGKRAEGASTMLHLIDVEHSLGCRAETLFAQARGLTRLAPTLAPDLPSPLGDDVTALLAAGATVGARRQTVELVPVIDS